MVPCMAKLNKAEALGIRLKLRYQSVNILPLEYYQDLINVSILIEK